MSPTGVTDLSNQLLYPQLPAQQSLDPLFFLWRERPLRTGRELTKSDRAVLRADEALHRQSHGRAHAPNLALLALGQHDLELPSIPSDFDNARPLRDGKTVI